MSSSNRSRKGKAGSKARKLQRKPADVTAGLPPLNLNAAAIDIGCAVHYVAVPPGRAKQNVREFGSFTSDLHQLVDWLVECGIDTVVMESTGVYWFALYELIEQRGMEVKLVNARYVKGLPGRKTDMLDCQWLQKLHTHGLLNDSFRPDEAIRVLRTFLRQRDNLVAAAATSIQHMQKALTEMNIQLANVLSDVTGVSGTRIIEAIIAGERDAKNLAKLCDNRVKATRAEIAESLRGIWKPELIFVLTQAFAVRQFYLEKIAECDRQVEAHLATFATKVDVNKDPLPELKKGKNRKEGHAPAYDLRAELYRISGADLTTIDAIGEQTAQVVISEVGLDMSRFKSEKHFTSWLGLCPDNRKSGGKVLSAKTRKTKNRAKQALRLAAQGLQSSKSALGANFRRLSARIGIAKATTAAAHKLARIIYRMLKYGKNYVDIGMAKYEERFRAQRIKWLQKQAAELHMQLSEIQVAA
jgi:transposase